MRYRVTPEGREADKARVRGWRQANIPKFLCMSARSRARKKGIPFALTPEDIVVPEFCPALGTRLTTDIPWGPDVPTLDRVDPAKGYVPGNVAVISYRANRIKNDATAEEISAVATWLEGWSQP